MKKIGIVTLLFIIAGFFRTTGALALSSPQLIVGITLGAGKQVVPGDNFVSKTVSGSQYNQTVYAYDMLTGLDSNASVRTVSSLNQYSTWIDSPIDKLTSLGNGSNTSVGSYNIQMRTTNWKPTDVRYSGNWYLY